MIKDIRNSKNLRVYLAQLCEIKSRLEFISAYNNVDKDRFVIESYALQVRMLIELLAYSLIAIHRTKYRDFRLNAQRDFAKDWNGRNIINNVLKLNPDMFFRPIESNFQIAHDGVKQVHIKNHDCYSLKKLGKLYDKCGGVLHAANPWDNSTKAESFHNELPSIISKLNNTISNHVVLVNHWKHQTSTAIIFTLNGENNNPCYYMSLATGNFEFKNA